MLCDGHNPYDVLVFIPQNLRIHIFFDELFFHWLVRFRSKTTVDFDRKLPSISISIENYLSFGENYLRFRLTKTHISIKISQLMIDIGIEIRPDVGIMSST